VVVIEVEELFLIRINIVTLHCWICRNITMIIRTYLHMDLVVDIEPYC
jgi:hypothetical protein